MDYLVEFYGSVAYGSGGDGDIVPGYEPGTILRIMAADSAAEVIRQAKEIVARCWDYEKLVRVRLLGEEIQIV